MKITLIPGSEAGGQAPIAFPGGAAAATAAVNDASGATDVSRQLEAYHALSNRWAGAGHGERASLTQALTDSPFARTIQTAVNTFTKAAWPGADAAPPAPQQKMLQAFDGLSADHQQIVASLQVGVQGPAPRPASVEEYRGRLQADLDAAQPKASAPRDSVTLSDEAKAWLAGGPSAAPVPAATAAPVDATPQMAAALGAYAKAAG